METKHIALISVGVIALVAVGYYLYTKNDDEAKRFAEGRLKGNMPKVSEGTEVVERKDAPIQEQGESVTKGGIKQLDENIVNKKPLADASTSVTKGGIRV